MKNYAITLLFLASMPSIFGFDKASLKSQQNFKEHDREFDYWGPFSPLEQSFVSAVVKDDLKKVKALLTQGADANFGWMHDQPHLGYTPLIIAVQNNSLPMAELLINAGADVHVMVETGGISDKWNEEWIGVRNYPILTYAIILNRPEIAQLLIQKGADVNYNANYHPSSPEKRALVRCWNPSIFAWNPSWTPLKVARYNKREAIAKMLIEAGAKE